MVHVTKPFESTLVLKAVCIGRRQIRLDDRIKQKRRFAQFAGRWLDAETIVCLLVERLVEVASLQIQPFGRRCPFQKIRAEKKR